MYRSTHVYHVVMAPLTLECDRGKKLRLSISYLYYHFIGLVN
jgi:hypothetical protein